MSNNELCRNGQLLSSQTKRFLSHFERNTLYLKNDTTWSNGEHITYGVTLTFTHSDVSRLLCNGLIGEYANPALSFTLHITSHRNTCSFNLTAGQPMRFQALDTKASKRQLITALSIAFTTSLLRSSVFCSFRL